MKVKKGVKTHLKERTEIFLLLSIHENGMRHDIKMFASHFAPNQCA